MQARGWDEVDFVCVTGDAYIDHPSFGIAIVSRLLEREGYRVAMLAQPNFHTPTDFCRFGPPRLGFLITAGNIDSMVAHYTAAKRKRSDDAYTPGGKAGRRPDRAALVYTALAKQAYPHLPVILGGLEASLRRFAHYDYWDDAVRPSVLLESGADLLVYGMGERQITAIATQLATGKPLEELRGLRGICYALQQGETLPGEHVSCASFERVAHDKPTYAKTAALQLAEQDAITGRAVVQKHGQRLLVQNPPALPLTTQELDALAALPYMRSYHPSYEAQGGVKAIEEVEFSIIHNRGCFGACNFCSIALHQGRQVSSRSHASVLAEAKDFTQNPRFKGYIHDVGGPTANFRQPSCSKQPEHGLCRNRRCLTPAPCPQLQADHSDYLELLRGLRALPGVKRVFIRSGIRYDYLNKDKTSPFLRELAEHHVSGQLKVAPEHCSAQVLAKMGKPGIAAYKQFARAFAEASRQAGKEQYLVPYFMSSHPGSRLEDALELALFLKQNNLRPEQVQDFYPTPGTLSTAMFYTGLDPLTMQPVYVARSPQEKRLQRLLLQYYKPEHHRELRRALRQAGRAECIGHGPGCLVPPEPRQRATPPPKPTARPTTGRKGKRKHK